MKTDQLIAQLAQGAGPAPRESLTRLLPGMLTGPCGGSRGDRGPWDRCRRTDFPTPLPRDQLTPAFLLHWPWPGPG